MPRIPDFYDAGVLNTHPSLLPSFPGSHAVPDALAAGVRVTGCTVFVVTAGTDDGPILAQNAVPVLATDDESSLHERIRGVERRLFPATIRAYMGGALRANREQRRRALACGHVVGRTHVRLDCACL
jgi:phosphoribosylglycinamide formyltransferase-1